MIPNHPETEQILLENVLFALGNPLRLSIIRRLADGSELSCNALRPEDVVKSTMTHHWRVLRDSGVIWQRPQGRENMISLRRDDLDTRFPGLMAILLRSGSLWAAILYHGLWNLTAFLVAHDAAQAAATPTPEPWMLWVPVAFLVPNGLYALWLLRGIGRVPPPGDFAEGRR